MLNMSFVVCLAFAIALPLANSLSHKNLQNQIHVIERYLSVESNETVQEPIPDLLADLHPDLFPEEIDETNSNQPTSRLKLFRFSWASCSTPNALVQISKLDISDPIMIPGDVVVSFNTQWRRMISSPLKVSVQVQRKVAFLWVDVPCINNIGSCTYQDFCSIIPFPRDKPCPEPFLSLGLPCNCPGSPGTYTADRAQVHIADQRIPEFLARGQYSVAAKASINDQEVVCIKLAFALA